MIDNLPLFQELPSFVALPQNYHPLIPKIPKITITKSATTFSTTPPSTQHLSLTRLNSTWYLIKYRYYCTSEHYQWTSHIPLHYPSLVIS